jgi:hypothetical protein
MGRILKTLAAILGGIIALAAAAYLYISAWYSPAIDARVVHATTGVPIEGAVVVANWELTGAEGYPIRELAVSEAVTDSNGEFEIPGWGPRFNFGAGHVENNQPIVRIWARGYVPAILDNLQSDRLVFTLATPIITTRLDGETVRLTPAAAAGDAYVAALKSLAYSMDFAYRSQDCEWRSVPRTLSLLHLAKQRGEDVGRGDFLRLTEHIGGPPRCGDPATELRGYLR